MNDKRSDRFSTPHLSRLLESAPLKGARIFKKGSSSIIFDNGDTLLRLTLQGSGHNFLSQQSASGNKNVVKVLRDYGAVALSDNYEGGPKVEFYWLAEVERLSEVDAASEPLLHAWLSTFEDDVQPGPADLPAVAEQCRQFASRHPRYAGFMQTLAKAAEFPGITSMDLRLENCMRRLSTGELVWTDPLDDCFYEPDPSRETSLAQLAAYFRGLTEPTA